MIGISSLVIVRMVVGFGRREHLIRRFCHRNLGCIGIRMMRHQWQRIDLRNGMAVKRMGFPTNPILEETDVITMRRSLKENDVLRSHRRETSL